MSIVPREELPLATLKLDSTKAVIDKTLIKEGKSVTSGYYKEAYNWSERTFINCDLRYYNLASLGKFDAILIDPPWRIKGNQLISNEKTMFNNSTCASSQADEYVCGVLD
jgi:16S rRNA G966 N2-methylase RsmD